MGDDAFQTGLAVIDMLSIRWIHSARSLEAVLPGSGVVPLSDAADRFVSIMTIQSYRCKPKPVDQIPEWSED